MPAQASRPLKIMILSMEYTPEVSGGVGTHAWELARGLRQADCQVCVLACTPGKSKTLRESNLTAHLISPGASSFLKAAKQSWAGSILAFTDDLVSKGREVIGRDGWRPDIIQCYNWLTFPAALQLGQMYEAPVLSVVQYVSEPVERWWGQAPDQEIAEQEKLLFRHAKMFITVSNSMRKIIQDTYGVADNRIHVVYNGMDPQPFINPTSKSDVIRQLRQTIARSNEKIALFAGRLNPHKGIAALLKSASQVVTKYPNVRYLLAGEPDSREFAQKIKHLLDPHSDLRGKITLLGKIPRRQLAALYQVADLALVPSVYEPFGYAAIEAMAAGVPVIASKVGGLAEIILHGQTGLLVQVHAKLVEPHVVDVEELIAAQLTLLNNETMARQLGRAGRQRVLEYFDLETMVQSTLTVYRNAISAFCQERKNAQAERHLPEWSGGRVNQP
jgi:glycosyltransferase involved in cell wall biosynthesis